ncbi:uncharacterized protein LOC126293473, partial [Schistocerca gregaria]|uniref:uncharacterized protein LOC126293473 n=1 Tax=Schistocerca gregaria TaxID=7010 RepID=UPI00211ECC00
MMNISSPSQAFPSKLYNKYRNTLMKLQKTTLNIQFNKNCLANKIIPDYIKNSVNSMSSAPKKVKKKVEILWLKQEIRELYTKKQSLNTELYQTHLDLANKFTVPAYFDEITNREKAYVQKVMQEKREKQNRKLNRIINSTYTPTKNNLSQQYKFHDRIINLTDIKLTTHEKSLLEKGPKHNINTNISHKTIENLITETEHIIKEQERLSTPNFNANLTRELVAAEITQIIRTHKSTIISKHKTSEETTASKLKQKLKQNNAIVTRADKGNITVIMDEKEYTEKTLDFLKDNNITKLTSDPTARYQRNIQQTLKNINNTFSKGQIKRMIQKNPKAPTLNSLPKVHKDNIPIRPVINFRSAPSYHLAQQTHLLLKKLYTFDNNRNLELIDRIKNIHIPDTATLISFDVTSMYTCIPINETINIITQRLKQQGNTPDTHI